MYLTFNSVKYYVSNLTQALAICSEFADEYGIDSKDKDKIVVRMKSKYINELKNMLENKSFKLKSFEVYGDEAIVYFVPKKRK
jgi:sporulation-control protein spo0M